MSKFIFYTDLHLSNMNPRHRKDNFSRSILTKLAEIYEYGKNNGAEFAVFGGDFFDVHRIYNYELISEAIEIIDSCGFETYAVIGQHDLKGYNPETYSSSTLAFMERHSSNWKTLYNPFEIGDMVLCPCHVNDSLDEVLNKKLRSKKIPVLVVHQLLYNKTSNFEVIPTSSLGKNLYRLILSGDLHCGFERHEIDGTVFANPGSVARRAISDDKIPQFLFVDTSKNIDIQTVLLQSALSFEDAFDESFVESVKETAKMDSSRFVDEILELEMETVDVFDLIEKVGKKKGIKKDVLEYIFSKKAV